MSSRAILHKKGRWEESPRLLGTPEGGKGLAVSQEREAVLYCPAFGGQGS